ncbi:MAG: bifunctional metallophosphatase/5'-nucleotidase [Candidatus Cloacimonetes bacterium]|nr:bifunctional metallophosphatase/5'-nucleotidase [Candidatus Cloacimonadota bacterium]
MKRILIVMLFLIMSILLIAEKLTVFFTNDTHGAYLPNTYKTPSEELSIGGYENLYNVISEQRATIPNTLWLDAGDQQTGSVFSSMVYNKTIGGAVVKAFNLMGLDGATFGNHEFDQSFENTLRLAKQAKYPYISTNVVHEKNKRPITNTPYKIFTKGSLKIGVLGLTMTDLREKVKIENVEKLNVLPYKQAIDRYLDELDEKTDLIILLTHIGFGADSLLAAQLDNRIDLIIGGHSHTVLDKPKLVNGIYIVQAGAYLAYYGRINLEVKTDRIVNSPETETCLYYVYPTLTLAESDFSRFFKQTTAMIDSDLNRVIGYTDVDWKPDKYKETAVSQWQAEALFREYYHKYKPDMAMINCGGIRKSIPAGDIRMRDMQEMLPFTNYITVFSCYGRDLQKFIEHNLELMQTKEHDIVQTYNLKWQTKDFLNDNKVWDIRVGNKSIEPDKLYRIVSHDYLTGQAGKYLLFKPVKVVYTKDLILDVMVRQVEKQLGKKKL